MGDSLSAVVPYRIMTIGNAEKVRLKEFIDAVEMSFGCKAIRDDVSMQGGRSGVLQRLTGHRPRRGSTGSSTGTWAITLSTRSRPMHPDRSAAPAA